MTTFNWGRPQRQPGKALIYVFYKTLLTAIKIFIPFLLTLLFKDSKKQGNVWEYTAVFIPVLALVVAVISYRFFRFYINDLKQLVVQKGIFTRKQVVLPLERVQAVNVQQQWLHRLTNLAEVTFDSPGTSSEEVKITLTLQQASALKEYIFLQKNNPAKQVVTVAEKPIPEPVKKYRLYDLDPLSLVRLGLTANHIETFLITLTFGYSLLQNIKNASDDYYNKSMDLVSGYMVYQSALGVFLAILLVLAVSVIISFFRIVLKYANFSIEAVGNRFRIRTGLINTKEVLVPFSKVQYISWRANWLRTKTKLYVLQFHNIGQLQLKEAQKVLIPLTRLEFLPQLLANYHPLLSAEGTAIRVNKSYISRMYILVLLPLLLVVLAIAWFYPFFYWGLLVVVYNAGSIYRFQQKFRMRFNEEVIHIQKGSYGSEDLLLLWHKIQTVTLQQSIYQRKAGLASVKLRTAGGMVTIPYIPLETANLLTNFALFKTATEKWQ